MSAWKTVACRLEESCLGIFDCPHTTAPDEGVGYPLIRTPNVGRGRLKLEGVHRVSESVYEQRNFRAKPEPGDLIFAREAPAGNVACIQGGEWVCLGQRTVLIRPDRKKLDSNFLAYYLLTEEKQQEFGVLANGATVAHVNMPDIRNLPISVPPLSTQRRIAAVLSSLDDKIENNRKICKNLEEQAQAIFKSWFVDFEPFGGEMPKEGGIVSLLDVAVLFDSKRIPLSSREREKRKGKFPYYGATSVMDYVDDYLYDGVYLLMGEDGSVARDNGLPYLQYVDGRFWVNNHAHVMQGVNGYSTEMLWCVLSQTDISSLVTGAVQPKLSQGNMRMIKVPLLPQGEMKSFARLIQPMFDMLRNCKLEIASLTELRDALLPKLMSGEIDVDRVEVA